MGHRVAILATEVSQFEGMRGACACLWPLELAISYFIKTSAKAKEIEGPNEMSHPGKGEESFKRVCHHSAYF